MPTLSIISTDIAHALQPRSIRAGQEPQRLFRARERCKPDFSRAPFQATASRRTSAETRDAVGKSAAVAAGEAVVCSVTHLAFFFSRAPQANEQSRLVKIRF